MNKKLYVSRRNDRYKQHLLQITWVYDNYKANKYYESYMPEDCFFKDIESIYKNSKHKYRYCLKYKGDETKNKYYFYFFRNFC